MYGMINQAIKALVTEKAGATAWEEVCQKVQCPTDFVSLQYYDDAITYDLVGEVSKLLNIPADQVLNAYGNHWVQYTAKEGYGPIMDLFGQDFITCLKNLNHLHSRMGMTLPKLRPPKFTLREVGPSLYELDYVSSRKGLGPMVIGLIEGLAKKHKVQIEVSPLPQTSDPSLQTFRIRIAG